MNPLIALEHLTKTFDHRSILAGLNLVVYGQQNLLITGPSGGGKTTLLRIIAGLETPDQGKVLIAGKIATSDHQILLPPHQRGLGMVFQDLGLWPNLSVLDNVLLGLAGCQLSRNEKKQRALQTLDACDLAPLAHRRPARLSGGEQQRAALARALAHSPKILLLDEPFANLDFMGRQALLNLIQGLSERFQTTVVLVSHNPADAKPLKATVAVLEDGGISEAGELQALVSNGVSRTMRAWRQQHKLT